MRKKFTKALALVCALCMLAPATTPAYAADDSSSYEGDSVIENDNSTIPKLSRVVLPTISEDTYDFTIDVQGLLSEFDPTNYTDGVNVYFLTEREAAKLTLPTAPENTAYKFVTKGKDEITDAGTSGTADDVLALVTGKAVTAFDTAGLYVWQPDENLVTTTGEGKFTAITSENYAKFFNVTLDADSKITGLTYETTPLAGDVEDIWDGKVYVDAYTDATATAATYYNAAANTFDASLFVEVTDSSSSPDVVTYVKPVVGTAGDGELAVTYTAATTQYNNTTNAATITNKSTFAIGVLANVTMTAPGLSFVAESALDTAHANPEIFVNIVDGASDSNVKALPAGDDSATETAAFVIPGTGANAETYQTNELNALGGHIYHQYLAPASTAHSASFKLEVGVDTDYSTTAAAGTTSTEAWDAYIAALTAATKPTVSVVYRFVEVNDGAIDGSNYTYEAANKAEFTITGNTAATTAAWATYSTTNVVKVTVATITNGTADKTQAEVGEVITVTPNVTTTGKMAGTASVTYFKTGDSGSATGTITDIALNDAGKYAITVPSDAITGAFTVTIAEVDKVGLELTAYEYTAGTATAVVVYPTTGVITTVNYKNAAGATIDLVSDTDYTISGNTITFAANSGKFNTISNNRKNTNSGDLTVTLCVTVNGTVYTADFTIHQAP